MTRTSTVLIVGAGLAGSLLALLLARRGHRVVVCERRPDPRAHGFAGGRSINLALSVRGITALACAGIAERVLAEAIPMRGRMIHAPDGELSFQPYSARPGDAIHSVSRAQLNLALLDAAAAIDTVSFRFEATCVGVDFDVPAAIFDSPGRRGERVAADVIFGCDGAFSAVRGAMQVTDRFDYSQHFLEHGYKELHIPPAACCGVDPGRHSGFALEPHALHIWPRGSSMMIALPNPDRSFTCTLFWPFKGRHGFDAIASPQDVRPFFEQHYPDAVPLMPDLVEDYQRHPASSLVTIRCRPWVRGRIALVGDAAHAIVPFFGQGMNAAFEDCRLLVELLDRHQDWDEALARYGRVRPRHADAIADMALDNFIEMRDRVGQPAFRYRKRIEQALHAMYPERAEPLYNLVSFSNVPYAEARRRGRRLARVVERIAREIPAETARTMDEPAWRDAVGRLGDRLLPPTPEAAT